MKATDLAFQLYREAWADCNFEVVGPNGCPIVDLIVHVDKKVIELVNWELAVEKKDES